MAHDVFISYPNKDKTVADAVCAKLEDQKIRCWIAPRDIPAGKNFAESIIDAIDVSKVFVLIWSINTNASEHILNEVNQAFNQGIPIIPFRIQEVEPTSAMRYYFGRKHWLDAITPPLEKHIETLATAILAILERTPEVIPAPVAVEAEPVAERPPPRETELSPPPVKDHWHDSKERRTVRPADKTETKSPPVFSQKRRIFIPIAAGVLIVVAIAMMILTGVFEGLPFAEKTEVVPPTTVVIKSTSKPTPIPATSTPTAMPAWMEEVNVWANPILAAIESQPPDFMDDFSRLDANWIVNSNEMYCPGFDLTSSFKVVNGELQLELGPSCQHFSFTHPMLNAQNSNFILQTDIKFPQTSTSYEIGVNIGNRSVVDFILNYTGWVLWTQAPGTEGEMLLVQEAPFPEELNTSVTFTILKNGTTYLFYVDDTLLLSYSSPGDDTGTLVIDQLVSSGGQDIDSNPIIMDNIRFWDLDSLFIPERVLAQTENQPPTFADDFSSVDPSWKFVEDPSGEYNPENANMEISDGSMKCSMRNVWGGVLSYSDMVYKNYMLQMDVDFKGNPIGMEFRMGGPSASNPNFRVGSPEGDWNFQKGQFSEVYTGTVAPDKKVDFSKPVRITIINKSPHFLVYLNSDQLLSFSNQDAEGPFSLDFVIGTGGSELLEQVMVDLDDVKIWDLDN